MLSVFYTAARFCLVHVTLILEVKYSLRSILLFTNTDVSTTKICLDTPILAKSIMGRKKYISFCEEKKTIIVVQHLYNEERMVIMEQWNFSFSITLVQYFKKWLHGTDHRFRTLIRVGALAVLFSHSAYVEMIRCFLTKIIIPCMLSTGVPLRFVYGHLCSVWRTAL
jgi:hypothetical protein